MNQQHKNDRVQAGDTIYIYYEELQNIPAIVSHIHDRSEGKISVKINLVINPLIDTSKYFIQGTWLPLVLVDQEWELTPRIVLQ
jgi:hypothetical protein